MAYGTPADPVGGTVITVAYAVANLLDPIRWLRLLTGNADPPGSAYVVVSTSTTGTNWAKITTDVLGDASVTLAKMGALSVGTSQLIDDSVTAAKIGPLAVELAAMAVDSVAAANIIDGNVTANKLATDSVTTAKIGAVQVTLAKMATDSVAAANIIDGNVTGPKLANDSVTTAKIQAVAVTLAKMAADSVAAANIIDGNVTANKLASDSVTAIKIAADAVTTVKMLDANVTAPKLASGAALANLGFSPAKITSGTYTGDNVSTGRQILTAFTLRLVLIQELSLNSSWYANNVTECMVVANGPTVGGSGDVHLHATDGFVVGDGSAQANVTGRTYHYTAFGGG